MSIGGALKARCWRRCSCVFNRKIKTAFWNIWNLSSQVSAPGLFSMLAVDVLSCVGWDDEVTIKIMWTKLVVSRGTHSTKCRRSHCRSIATKQRNHRFQKHQATVCPYVKCIRSCGKWSSAHRFLRCRCCAPARTSVDSIQLAWAHH